MPDDDRTVSQTPLGFTLAAAARKLFAFSLIYVFVLFAALLVDNGLTRLGYGL